MADYRMLPVEKQQELPGISLFTYTPVPNTLADSGMFERELLSRMILVNLLAIVPKPSFKKEGELGTAVEKHIREKLHKAPFVAPAYLANELSPAAGQLAAEIKSFAGADLKTAVEILDDFKKEMATGGWKQEDLMSVLLVVMEKRMPPLPLTPEKIISPEKYLAAIGATDATEAKILSIRELVKVYFKLYPNDYGAIMSALLGISADSDEDRIYLQQRIAYEVARIGSYAMAHRVMVELKRRARAEEKDRILMGLLFDPKKKRLSVCKKWLGNISAAKILAALEKKIASKLKDS
jgi:hypothetical protein